MSMILLLAVALSLDGEWRLDYFPQPDDRAVRDVAAVPSAAKESTRWLTFSSTEGQATFAQKVGLPFA